MELRYLPISSQRKKPRPGELKCLDKVHLLSPAGVGAGGRAFSCRLLSWLCTAVLFFAGNARAF